MKFRRPTIRPGRDYNYRARQQAIARNIALMRALRNPGSGRRGDLQQASLPLQPPKEQNEPQKTQES